MREFDGLRCCLECGEIQFSDDGLQNEAQTEEQEYIYTDLQCLERGRTIRLVLLEYGAYNDPLQYSLVLPWGQVLRVWGHLLHLGD
jgi:hypothetical protein